MKPEFTPGTRIVFASELPECECCGEPWCPTHNEHYADCECVGPGNAEDEGWTLDEIERGTKDPE